MKLIDILIFSLSAAGLVYFMFDRLKYSNRNVYTRKLERLYELEIEIRNIKSVNNETEKLINNMNPDMDFDDSFTDKLIKYRDDADKLEALRNEHREIDLYLRKTRSYIKEFH
jgi:hypothetical protein